jgi:hypothetical protein
MPRQAAVPQPGGRRKGLAVAAALVGVAVLGGGAAVAYRTVGGAAGGGPPLIKAEPGPSKVAPTESGESAASEPAVDGKELRTGQERVVPREEKIAALPQGTGKQPARISLPTPEQQGDEFEPRRVRTLIVRPDGTIVREDAAAPSTGTTPAEPVRAAPAPKAADSQAAAPSRPAAATQPVEPATQPAPKASDAGPAEPTPSNRAKVAALRRDPAPSRDAEPPAASAPWTVQLISQKSENLARSALAAIQKKHQAVLGRHKPQIAKVELGSKGTYYRVQVGVGSQEAANKLCSGLKAAGASCLVHRN